MDVTPTRPEYRQLAAPTAVVVLCLTVVVLAMIGAFTALALHGSSAEDLSRFVNTIFNLASVLLSGGAALYAGSADRKAGRAVQNTNHALDERVAEIMIKVVREELARDRVDEESNQP